MLSTKFKFLKGFVIFFDYDFLQNKQIYIAPYNDLAIELKIFLDKHIQYHFQGFIDKEKCGAKIYGPDKIGQYDIILIFSPNYFEEINKLLLHYKHKQENILLIEKQDQQFRFIQKEQNYLERRKKIVCFGNCQANHLAAFLSKYLSPLDYIVKGYLNYREFFKPEEIYLAMKEADIIIYQPLKKSYTKLLSDKNIRKEFAGKQLLSFPFVYNSGIYALEYDTGIIIGEEVILKLYKSGKTKAQIIRDFVNDKIDFDLEKRFQKSLDIMKKKEKNTDIKLTEFIKNNYKTNKLFAMFMHPTNFLYLEIVRQVNELLCLGIDVKKKMEVAEQEGVVTVITPYELQKNGYTNEYYIDNWRASGILIIDLILTKEGVIGETL